MKRIDLGVICTIAFSPLIFHLTSFAATPTTNPADLELEAFGQLHQLSAQSRVLEPAVDDIPLNQTTADFLTLCGPVEQMLRQAAAMPVATWPEIKTESDLFGAVFSGCRLAAHVLQLQSRWDCSQGRFADAADDLLAAMALGRHVAQQRLMAHALVAYGIEGSTINAFARLLTQLPPAVLQSLPQRFKALPQNTSLGELLDGEEKVTPRLMESRLAKEKLSPQEKAILLKNMAAGANKLFIIARSSADLPPTEFSAVLKAAADNANDPLMQIVIPPLVSFHEQLAIIRAKAALLDAAVFVQLGGAKAIAQTQDPFGKGPFTYQSSGAGYRLSSALHRTHPTTQTVSLDIDVIP